MEIPKISKVKSQRGRTYGSNIYLDITLEMNPDLSVFESHEIADQGRVYAGRTFWSL